MEIRDLLPVILYDNRCFLCTKFAEIIKIISGDKFLFIGHYTALGKEIREKYLDSNALEMFWVVKNNTAFGGRSALLPLIIQIFSFSKRAKNHNQICYELCDNYCSGVGSFFVRSASLFLHSKKITIQ